jgi:hypothetical protein
VTTSIRKAKWLLVIAVAATVLGVILFSQLGRIDGLDDFLLLQVWETLTFAMIAVGLAGALAGSAIWARYARLHHLPVAALCVGFLGLVLSRFVHMAPEAADARGPHGPTAIFVLVIPVTIVIAVMLLLIGAARFVLSRRRQQANSQ